MSLNELIPALLLDEVASREGLDGAIFKSLPSPVDERGKGNESLLLDREAGEGRILS